MPRAECSIRNEQCRNHVSGKLDGRTSDGRHSTSGIPLLLVGAFTAMITWHGALADTALTADQIMQLNFQVDRVAGARADATMTLTNDRGEQRVRESVTTSKLEANGIDNERMVRFRSPEDVKGTAILLIEHSEADDDMWIFLPALGKSRRLVASNKRDSFVGSDFSYGDIIGYPVEQWHNKIVGESAVQGEPCYLVESTPVSNAIEEMTGYSKRLSCISKSRSVTLHADIWDSEGEKFKEEDYSNYENVDPAHGKWVAMRITAQNLETNHNTVVLLKNYRLDAAVSQSELTTRALEFGP